jgi:hypothetical protein
VEVWRSGEVVRSCGLGLVGSLPCISLCLFAINFSLSLSVSPCRGSNTCMFIHVYVCTYVCMQAAWCEGLGKLVRLELSHSEKLEVFELIDTSASGTIEMADLETALGMAARSRVERRRSLCHIEYLMSNEYGIWNSQKWAS